MREMIIQRSRLLQELRAFFDKRGFNEVQPPCLCRDCVVDAYLDPITVNTDQLGLSGDQLPAKYFLQTSPESAMKRMLTEGAPSIYSIGPVFRSGEQGDLHNPEFTMLEWYDLGASQDAEIRLLGDLSCQILNRPAYEVESYRNLFQKHLGLDPIDEDLESLVKAIDNQDTTFIAAIQNDRNSILDILLSQQIQPQMSHGSPLIVHDYPLGQAALAKPSVTDPQCAGRFELFVDGVELANGYDELLDADELIRRAKSSNEVRRTDGREPLQEETTLAAAMRRGLPACCGVALGVDRLLMLQTGAKSIGDILPLPIDRV